MPKRPQFENPVQHLRTLLGKTQPQFAKELDRVLRGKEKSAKELGVSASRLQKIEHGERRLPVKLADHLSALYGVDAPSLMNKRGKARSFDGRVLTDRFLDAWRRKLLDENDQKTILEQLLSQLNALLFCSRKLGHGEQRLIAAKLSTVFRELIENHHLSLEIERFLNKIEKSFPEQRIAVEELNAFFKDVPQWKKISSKYSVSEVAVVKETHYPIWAEQGGAVVITNDDGSKEIAYVSSQKLRKEVYEIRIRNKVHHVTRPCFHRRLIQKQPAPKPPQTEPSSTLGPE